MKHLTHLIMLCVLALLTAPIQSLAGIPVIYDSDIGDDIDDTWALGLLLQSPELDLKLVVGDQGKPVYRAKLFAKFLESTGHANVPVGIGMGDDRDAGGAQSAWVKGYDLKQYPGRILEDGVQAIIDTIMNSPEPITLLCVGPVPNIAEALRREPAIAKKARFVGMHGSVRLGYGGSKDIHAEYNVKADASACQTVFKAAWPMTITPLDTCGLVDLRGDRYAAVKNSLHPVARAIMENYKIWSGDKQDVFQVRSSTLFDTVAVYLTFSQAFCTMETLGIRVDDQGFTRIDANAKTMNVATAWTDMDAFKDLLVHRVTGGYSASAVRRIAVAEYVDRMKAGWVGQMAGVGWGAPTEFRWKGQIIPEDKMPQWKPEMVNQFGQDDLYVEMTFLKTLEDYGLDCTIRQAGIDFANSGYQLWHANKYGRDNLRSGIAPPDSGHPKFNAHADDIDYQIEADFSGLIAPGMPNLAIELGEKFGRLMNYGDGLYGGQFVAGMYAEAFFETDIETIIRAGLACVPQGSQFHECMTDTIRWYHQHPGDWQKTWGLIEAKYQDNPDYRRFSCDKGDFNIDAKINAAYIIMGLLYGEGDIDKTIGIATRCGQDSDCNPSNAAGILCTAIGFSKLPERFTKVLDPNGKFSHTPYTFPKLISVCEQLVRQAVVRSGGSVAKDKDGREFYLIPREVAVPSALEQCWAPGPIANSRFTEAEMKQITAVAEK
ncbi:MAG: nucleoside hydrolase [Phycisphaerae bacterium]|nr:nucleoside hydrolase [Phycisphaerae bacterium]